MRPSAAIVSTSLLGSQKLVRTETTVSAAIKIQDAHYTRRLCRCRRGHGKPASGVTKQHNMVGIDPGLLPQRSNCRHDILGGNAGGEVVEDAKLYQLFLGRLA